MNEALIEQLGLKPLAAELAKIDDLQTQADVVRHFGTLQYLGVTTPIGFYVDQDDKNSTNISQRSSRAARHCPIVTTIWRMIPSM